MHGFAAVDLIKLSVSPELPCNRHRDNPCINCFIKLPEKWAARTGCRAPDRNKQKDCLSALPQTRI